MDQNGDGKIDYFDFVNFLKANTEEEINASTPIKNSHQEIGTQRARTPIDLCKYQKCFQASVPKRNFCRIHLKLIRRQTFEILNRIGVDLVKRRKIFKFKVSSFLVKEKYVLSEPFFDLLGELNIKLSGMEKLILTTCLAKQANYRLLDISFLLNILNKAAKQEKSPSVSVKNFQMHSRDDLVSYAEHAMGLFSYSTQKPM